MDMLVFGQVGVHAAAEFQGRGQIHVMGRGAALGGDALGGQQMDRAGLGPRADGVDHDGPIEADHALHQTQSAPAIFGHFDVRPAGQQGLQLLGHPQTDAVVAHHGIAEAEDEGFHAFSGRR